MHSSNLKVLMYRFSESVYIQSNNRVKWGHDWSTNTELLSHWRNWHVYISTIKQLAVRCSEIIISCKPTFPNEATNEIVRKCHILPYMVTWLRVYGLKLQCHSNALFFWIYLRNKSWNLECVGSFNMDWRILVFYPEPEARNTIY